MKTFRDNIIMHWVFKINAIHTKGKWAIALLAFSIIK